MTRATQIESPAALVDRLFNEAFAPGRAPRSVEYMAGVRALLTCRVYACRFFCPHMVGTAQADAFYAGADEGRALWCAHELAAQRDGGNHGAH